MKNLIGKFKKLRLVPLLLLCLAMQVPGTAALAESVPSMAFYKIKESSLLFPEKVQGTVFKVLDNGRFIMNEKIYLVCRESEVNGEPAYVAKYFLNAGTKVSVTRYRLKNKNYFVYSMTILSR